MRQSTLAALTLGLMILITGCATTSTPQINPNLQTVSNVKTISDMNAIAFEWSPAVDPDISGYIIYRSTENGKKKQIAKIKDRFTTHYLDKPLEPLTNYAYEIKTFDSKNLASQNSQFIQVTTLDRIDSVPFAQAIYGLPERVKLIWRPHPDLRVASYVIQRRTLGEEKWSNLDTVYGRLNAEYIDTKLKSNTNYQYRIFVKTADHVLSKPSEILSAVTKALPNVVINVKVSKNLPKKIELSWEEASIADFSHYNIYSTSNQFIPYTLLAKTDTNRYDDFINENGKTRFYKITTVDKDGLESLRAEVPAIGSTLSSPMPPQVTGAYFNGNSIVINWNDGDDNRGVKFNLIKSSKFGKTTITDIRNHSYIDSDISLGNSYSYELIAIDEFGLNSKSSYKVTVKAQ